MKEKGRKLLALFTMLAVIVTYSFSASIVSVYAEDEQGEVSAKAVAAESAAPAEQKEAKAKEPAPEQAAPAAEEAVGNAAVAEAAPAVEEAEAVAAEEEPAAEEAVKEEPSAKAPPVERTLNYDASYTCNPQYHPSQGQVEHWEVVGPEGTYTWDESSLTITNKNRTDRQQTVTITHTINIPGNNGFSKTESWKITLNIANMVTVTYFTVGNSRVHQDESYQPDYKSYTVWGIPERPGYIFLGWALRPPVGPDDVYCAPGATLDLTKVPGIAWFNKRAYVNLYAVWEKDNADLGTVTGKSDSVLYNGEEQVLEGIVEGEADMNGFVKFKTVTIGSGPRPMVTEYYVKASDVYAKGTEVGTYNTAVDYVQVYALPRPNQGGKPMATGKYIKVKPGTLEILDAFDGEVTGNSKTVSYTGEEQYLYGITADPSIESGFVAFAKVPGPKYTTIYYVKAEDIYAKGTEPGEYTTEQKQAKVYSWSTGSIGGKPIDTGKYVKVNPGTLTIIKTFDGEVTGNSKTVPYNGEEQAVYGITADPEVESGYVQFASTSTGGGHPVVTIYYVKAEDIYAKGTDAGKYNTEVEYARVYSKGANQHGGTPSETDMYVKVNPGTLTITPVELKLIVTAETDTRDYTGTPQMYVAPYTVEPEEGSEGAEALSNLGVTQILEHAKSNVCRGKDYGYYYTHFAEDLDKYSFNTADGTLDKSVIEKNFKVSFDITQGWMRITGPATLTFKLNGGTLDGSTEDYEMECNIGDEITIPDAPTRDGYEFVEWRGSSYQPGDTYEVTGDHTFNAIWKSTSTGGDSDSDANDGDGVDTGDSMNLGMTLALMTLAVIAILGLIFWRRREA